IAGFWIGMGILTKGQVAYLIVCICFFVYWIYERFRFYVTVSQFLFFTLSAAAVMLTWYGLETWQNGPEFIIEFNKYQYRLFSTPDAGHKGFPGYHFAILLVGCFPASIFTIRAFRNLPPPEHAFQQDFIRWMKILFWVVLILFSVVQSKIVHYSSMCYYPLTFLSAYVIHQIWKGKIEFHPGLKIALISIGLFFTVAIFGFSALAQQPETLKTILTNPFAHAALEAEASWTGWEFILGFLWLGVLFIAFRLLRTRNAWPGWVSLFGGTALIVFIGLSFFIRNIEAYSQRAAIEWFESKVGEDAYIIPMGYRTYGHLFYSKRQPPENPKAWDNTWLFWKDIDKDVYIVTKVHKAGPFREIPGFEVIEEKNGFVFLKRPKSHRNAFIEDEERQ
ncbi:MAG: glycosyl transferase, partial [Bacteroidota bacterium]